MENLRLTLVQMDIAWLDRQANLNYLSKLFLKLKGQTDLVVLPEMFTTGFTEKSKEFAEPMNGLTIQFLKKMATDNGFAIAGSIIIEEEPSFYNRFLFITPEQKVYHYDKKHLFRLSGEIDNYTAGKSKIIIHYKGWNICPQICYDLRFPVWSRNVNNEYDLLIYSASWPKSRIDVWDSLLKARALENQSFVCGVNRIGIDGNQLIYNGKSILFDAKGRTMSTIEENKEEYQTVNLSKYSLSIFRENFPVWKDSDSFQFIKNL